MTAAYTWYRSWPTWLKVTAIIIIASLIINYWQWSLALAVVAGVGYSIHRRRMEHIARHAACLAEITRLERELGIVAASNTKGVECPALEKALAEQRAILATWGKKEATQ